MVEGDALGFERGIARDGRLPVHARERPRVGGRNARDPGATDTLDGDEARKCRQAVHEFCNDVCPCEVTAAVVVTIAGDENLGPDLLESVEHALRTQIRRAHGPGRTQCGDGVKRNDALRHVVEIGNDAVAALDTKPAQGVGERHRLSLQFGPA